MSVLRSVAVPILGVGVMSYRGLKRAAPYVARGAIVAGCAFASAKFATAVAVGAGIYYGVGLAGRAIPVKE